MENLEKQREENEIDRCLFLQLAQEGKFIITNWKTV